VLEALQNAAKYARANRADVRLFASNGALTFVVEDDGVGFDSTTSSGSGLINMRDRLEALGGGLDVRSSVDRGTTVTGTVPLSPDDSRPSVPSSPP
jgi:signal transduction histidine kinase